MPNQQMNSANKPTSAEGRTYHVETKPGEVANRIIAVGDPQRAHAMARHLDKILFSHTSHRGFVTITGLYNSLPVSIVAIGMGLSMMDFFVRECRMVTLGPLAIVRFGSCGSICSAKPGDVIIANKAFAISRNFDYFTHCAVRSTQDPYNITLEVPGDKALTAAVEARLCAALGEGHVVAGSVGNADSFYGSQGRTGDDFCDQNAGLIDRIRCVHADAVALEMESHMLFHLAAVSTGADGRHSPSVAAACALMVFADRTGNSFIDPQSSAAMVEACSRAILDSLVECLPSQDGLHPQEGSVWEGLV